MEKANMDSLLEPATDLAIHSLSNRYWRKGPKVRAEVRNLVRESLVKGKKTKRLDWQIEKSKMIAFYSAFGVKRNQFGYTQRTLDVHRHRRSATALKWVEKQIRKNRDFYNSRTMIHLTAKDQGLLRVFLRNGFHIDCVIQVGEVKSCYQNLMQKRKPPKDFKMWGLRVSPLRTRAEVKEVLAIEHKEFSRNPQFGWFIALPSVRRRRRQSLMKKISMKGRYVLKNGDGKVVGYFSCQAGFEERLGSKAGIGLVLSQEIQGKGLLKAIYRFILEDLRERNIRIFVGGTSQIPVMKFSRLMGRINAVYLLRYGPGFFYPEYFLNF